MTNPLPANRSRQTEENIGKLREKLRELFQLDRGDLDFGLYRIMALKSVEVNAFLENDLLPQVTEALGEVADADALRLKKELDESLEAAKKHTDDPENSMQVQQLRAALEAAQPNQQAEADAYNHLCNFFSRYYDEGDFMSLRRYKSEGREAYAIPYNGEEVKLHWANSDQYYIKTTENYASYVFIVGEGNKRRRVRFQIDAADNEKDNIKETNEQQRHFVLAKNFIAAEKNELIIRFDHRPLSEAEKKRHPQKGIRRQASLNTESEKAIRGKIEKIKDGWQTLLFHSCPTAADQERTVLGKHLTAYTAKNSFDYFIHKDLGGFLRRELNYYLKSDVMSIDNLILTDEPAAVIRSLAQIKAIKLVGEKIIDFLAQLENFQKRLWLKKKFVLETQYCVTLDKVPESLYAEIIENQSQHDEWVKLFAIDELKGDLADSIAYSKKLKPAFLKANPYLVLDTRHFEQGFVDKLLAALSETGPIEEQMNGLLVHGENFQVLNLLQERYREQVEAVCIDPPFNTRDGDFAYKDQYPSSSWLSAMFDRFSLAKKIMSDTAQMAVHIDENEQENLNRLLTNIFGENNNLGPMIWDKRNPKGDARGLAIQHEFVFWVTKSKEAFTNRYGSLSRPKQHANAILRMAEKLIKKHRAIDDAREPFRAWLKKQTNFPRGELAYSEIDENGDVSQTVSMSWPNKSKAPPEYFIPLVHPGTGRPCPVPYRGWRNPPATMKTLLQNGKIIFGENEETQPRRKYLLRENMSQNISSVFEHGGSADTEAKNLGLFFDTMKPLAISEYICDINHSKGVILDYFAGSGTSGHAVININRVHGGNRKYVLVEMGKHFDDVLLPRMKKVVYSKDWKDGKPEGREGISQLFRYVRTESYEDSLDSLFVKPPEDLLKSSEYKKIAEDYQLRYALGEETAESVSLVGKNFIDPFNYNLSVVREGVRRDEKVDLAETFNFLLGLRLTSRRQLDGVLTITGTNPKGENCLILWRDLAKMNTPKLDKWFAKHRKALGDDLNRVYVNGDHTLNAFRKDGDQWEALTTEPVFRALMFAEV